MALVQYSDSEAESGSGSESESAHEPLQQPAKKRRLEHRSPTLPPLPAAFHDLYASSTRVSIRDDPNLHGGRKRAIPHVEGNWPTHIYLEWYPSKNDFIKLDQVVTRLEDNSEGNIAIHSLLQSDLGAQLPLHISLSRPVVLQTEQRTPFLATFQHFLQDSNIAAFDVTVEGLDWVSNYEKTRWFLVLRVCKHEKDYLNTLLRLSNSSLAHFGQPPLYGSPHQHGEAKKRQTGPSGGQAKAMDEQQAIQDFSRSFHISLAWCLTEPSPEDKRRAAKADLRALEDLSIRFCSVKAKIGNHVTSLQI
ncbi:hypothetical protein ASPZODRAFT_25980 [Penicilliopsis zonata CBS 506.65]|uniref:U6 snRNA phosphodiesterase n=1 Tax=Penicilliopsis zonata CBS 506.65 TaxID=1073090 RepID=A0A1L9SG32_9EURO|nr:hypothetical protein ASPZODRAFT_25980 [Penicilliopsis zonata CBS 506.65]OJJ46088.1 hypothetical protein ASPZODRAFT_25980 [Penicilliopsis zonata CBS 506.65]